MRIFISGNPGVGKTTLVRRIYEKYPNVFIGFWTEEIRKDKKRVGFKIKTTWGEEKLLASIERRSPYRVGKYFVYPENLDPVIEYLEKNYKKDKILLIDEIGRMEFYSKKFTEFINKILKDESIPIIATIHRNCLCLVKHYIWLEREKWWEIFKRIEREIELWLKSE